MLGQIKHGSCRPRAILFKVLADTVGLESRLVVVSFLCLSSYPFVNLRGENCTWLAIFLLRFLLVHLLLLHFSFIFHFPKTGFAYRRSF